MKIHFLGIGGSGASAVAAIAQAQGYEVTGCDKDLSSEFLKPFDKKQLYLNHNPNHLEDIEMLVVTPAVFSLDKDSKELIRAQEKGIPVITWQEFLGKYLAKDGFVIAISGTHGKSTTTAMTAQLLEDAGMDPTVVLGAIVPRWQANYRVGNSEYFVVEADEFNDNFLNYTPDISVVTNIEMDHPEYFKDFEAVKESFKKFLSQTKHAIIANLSDAGISSVIPSDNEESVDSKPTDPSTSSQDDNKKIIDYSTHLIGFPLQIPGEYNILNASAVFQVGKALNIDEQTIQQSLQNYTGLGRRFEKIGQYNGALIYSDFGHHPTEIKVTIEASRKQFPEKKLWVIFQPHMFARTKGLFNDFVKVFQELPVDGTAILDIYPSREKDTGIVSSKELVDAVGKENVEYVSSWEELKQGMEKSLGENDVVFFMGAGDTHKWATELVS